MFQLRTGVLAAISFTIALPASASAAVIVNSFYHTVEPCVFWSATTGARDFSCSGLSTTSSNPWVATDSTVDTNPVGSGEATVEHASYVAASLAGVTSFGAELGGTGTAGVADSG